MHPPIFSLEQFKVKLSSVNLRAEFNGDDTTPAVDIKLSLTCSNDVLSEFHPDLKSAFFKKSDSGELDLEAGHLSALRFPNMENSIKLSDKYEGYELVIHYGIDDKSNINLSECKVDKFQFVPKEGGSVDLSFSIAAHPKEAHIGKLSSMLQKDIDVTLTPPEEVQQKLAA
jgi:hypothetical protein